MPDFARGKFTLASGEGEFTIHDRAVQFDSFILENPHAKTRLDGL